MKAKLGGTEQQVEPMESTVRKTEAGRAKNEINKVEGEKRNERTLPKTWNNKDAKEI